MNTIDKPKVFPFHKKCKFISLQIFLMKYDQLLVTRNKGERGQQYPKVTKQKKTKKQKTMTAKQNK